MTSEPRLQTHNGRLRFVCPCGYLGPWFDTFPEARSDYAHHRRQYTKKPGTPME